MVGLVNLVLSRRYPSLTNAPGTQQKGRPQAPSLIPRVNVPPCPRVPSRRSAPRQPPIDLSVTMYSIKAVNSSTVRPAARPAGIID